HARPRTAPPRAPAPTVGRAGLKTISMQPHSGQRRRVQCARPVAHERRRMACWPTEAMTCATIPDPTAEATRARVLVVDDHALTRAGVRAMLARDPDLELVGEATNGREAMVLVESLQPDLVLMDVRMPDTDGVETTRLVKQTKPLTSVLILSMFEDVELLIQAIKAGAAGYVLKAASTEELRRAMAQALAGEFPIDRGLAQEVLRRVAQDTAPKQ